MKASEKTVKVEQKKRISKSVENEPKAAVVKKTSGVSVGKKRTRKEMEAPESSGASDSGHSENWKEENAKEIGNLDDEITQLEKKLGLSKDAKRKKRNDEQTNNEGFGKGFA